MCSRNMSISVASSSATSVVASECSAWVEQLSVTGMPLRLTIRGVPLRANRQIYQRIAHAPLSAQGAVRTIAPFRTFPAMPRPREGNDPGRAAGRSEEHTSELQSLMRISYAVFCLKKINIKRTEFNPYNKH